MSDPVRDRDEAEAAAARWQAAAMERTNERDAALLKLAAESNRADGNYKWGKSLLEEVNGLTSRLQQCQKDLADDDVTIDNAANQITALQSRLSSAVNLVNEQAEDDGLWFDADTAPEAYLQQELRKLHAAIEGSAVERHRFIGGLGNRCQVCGEEDHE